MYPTLRANRYTNTGLRMRIGFPPYRIITQRLYCTTGSTDESDKMYNNETRRVPKVFRIVI
jgi:hypothetical protein